MTTTRTRPPARPSAGLLCLLAGLAALAAPAACLAQTRAGGFAAITVEPSSVDFGRMDQHQTRSRDLLIRNDGAADLELGDITTSCGCTVAQPDTRRLAPGQSTRLKVTFDSREYQGERQNTVTIKSNDPATPTLEVPLKAFVFVPVMVQPERKEFKFGRVRRGQVAVQKSWLTATDAKELKVTPGRLPENLFRVETQEAVDGNPKLAIVTVRLKQDAPYGPFQEILRVDTNVPGMERIDFEVAGEVLHDLEVYPPVLNYRYVDVNKPLSTELRVRPTEGALKFKVLRAETDLAGFKVRVEERIPGRETVVVLSGQPLPADDPRVVAAKGRMQGTVRIFTDHADQPELQVKVTYLLRL